ncbi:MAG: glycoside hydrolase 43 family protein [Treponema sp.]|nr:glycoside hydrolase 43 family protein [Treponema sp.]
MTKTVKKAVNPVIYADMPDPDVIRVGNTFYMVSTTMHFMPGCVILRSYNLADWEIAAHVYDKLEDYGAARMENGKNIYGSGMWAASLKFWNGKFYVLHIANDTHCSYLYTSEKIEGPWTQTKIAGFYYDPGLFFDDDGRAFVVHGNREIRITELAEDLKGPKAGGFDKVILRDKNEVPLGYEGSHLYKINGKYILTLIHWPAGKMRTEAVFMTEDLNGEWKGGDVLCDDMGDFGAGVAQGGLVDTPDGDWYGVLFQDHGAQGRMPCLVPVKFQEDGYPVFGVNGKAPKTLEVKDFNPGYKYEGLSQSDDFDYACDALHPELKSVWEWNHIPKDENWWIEPASSGRDGGTLCIRTEYRKQNLVTVRNTLTQRVVGPEPKASVTLDASELKDGDVMGLAAFESCYGFAGLTKENGKVFVVRGVTNYPDGKIESNRNNRNPDKITDKVEIDGVTCQVKLDFDFKNLKDEVTFWWRASDKDDWKQIGKAFKLRFMLDHFCGARAALFVYSVEESGGTGKFQRFRAE